ncbi:MAG TPA: AAA family ATPase [Candidatus Dormibacteraeota bacterium]
MSELSDPSERHASGVIVGRDRELSHGAEVLGSATRGQGRLLLISGEPGIGKSRLADELARRARDRGFQVAWGRCWEAGGAPAYWPWVQSLRSLMRTIDVDTLWRELGENTAAIGQLLPGLRRPLDDAPTMLTQDPDAARFRLFDSVATVLTTTARRQPLMVVLDDLQVADTPSLLLLRFVSGIIGTEPIVVLATYRDADPILGESLAETVAELLRVRGVSRIALRGLAETDVSSFIESVTGVVPHDPLARVVHRETEGNPLFIEEVARMLLDEGRLEAQPSVESTHLPVPRSVREVIVRRLRPFRDECVRALRVASIFGREFSVEALSALAQTPADETLELLRRPREERVVIDVPDSRGRLRFGHVLIRECLYDDIAEVERRELHRTALAVMESLYQHELHLHLSELAHHAYEGASEGHWKQSISYAGRAGDQALSLLAYEEAVRLYRLALGGLDRSHENQPLLRCELLLALGDAQGRAGDEAEAKESFLLAADLARELGRNDHLATAALGYSGRHAWGRAGGDVRLVPLLEAGVVAVGKADSPLRARLLARLAGALRDAHEREPRESFGREAVEIARRVDDPATLAYALYGLYSATYRPDNVEERAMIAAEIVRIGEVAHDREVQVWGHFDRLMSFFDLGELQSVHDEISAIGDVAGELREPVLRWIAAVTGAALALAEGRLADVESLAMVALDAGPRSRSNDALAGYAGHMFQLRREQGRVAEVDQLVQQAARELTWYPLFRCALVAVHLDLGRKRQARAGFEALATSGFGRIPFDNHWIFNMSLLGDMAHALHDQAAATVLYERLQPYAQRNAYASSEACLGSVSRSLGLLAQTLGRYDDAQRHFEDGLAHNRRMGARLWVAHTQHEFARLLLEQRGVAEHGRARAMLTEALQACEDIGMPVLRATIAALLEGAPAAPNAAPPPTPLAERDTIALEGEYWTVTFAGRAVRLRDTKGMRILARLMSTPGRPHLSLDLERIGETADESTARAAAASDAGEMLDDEARRAYRARIAELRAAIDTAQSIGASERAGVLQEELDFITRELSHGIGLGGRARRAGSAAERARINVTRAVKTALQRIAEADSDLAAHLNATVRTGTVCVYAPDPRSPIEWTVTPATG